MKVLISAYACEPGRGSEPEVGWNWVLETARLHETWVFTRSNNRGAIEAALGSVPDQRIHFTYIDLPKWLRWWKKLPMGVQVYYYLWQILAYWPARRLHQEIQFDVVHHVTFCTYWLPSLLAFLPTRFIWGPVGGGETTPAKFFSTFSLRGKLYEWMRTLAQTVAGRDPLLRATAQRATIALATTDESAERLMGLGCKNVHVFSQVGITSQEIESLEQTRAISDSRAFRLCSAGRLEHLKGLDLALKAVARITGEVPQVEYWIFGIGPERARLERLASELRIEKQVRFWGETPRHKLLESLTSCDLLLHTGLHESGGLICTEAMAAGCPVVCLNLGGLAVQVTAETGIKVPALSPEQAVRDLADALRMLAQDPARRRELSSNARVRASQCFRWDRKIEAFWDLVNHHGMVSSSQHSECNIC